MTYTLFIFFIQKRRPKSDKNGKVLKKYYLKVEYFKQILFNCYNNLEGRCSTLQYIFLISFV